jgi:hypothetical protein
MDTAAIAYRNDELEACEQRGLWTVRLGKREARSRYLDLALAGLLGDVPEAHRVAARLLFELADPREQEAADQRTESVRPRRQRRKGPAKPLLVGLRVVVLSAVASTAFMVTTWLSTLR